MKTQSMGESRYFMLIIDDHSRICWVYFLQNKGEAFEAFKNFKAFVKKQSGKCVKALKI